MTTGVSTLFPADQGRKFQKVPTALVVVAVTLAVVLWGRPDSRRSAPAPEGQDAALWATFVEHLSQGKPYYPTAVRDYHAKGFPTFSVANFRQPLLYQGLAWLGVSAMLALRAGLVLLLVARVWRQLGWLSALFVGHACLFVFSSVSVYFAEPWAGVLILLSLLASLRGNVPLAVAWALVGLSVRELVAPYVAVMVALAVYRARWRDVLLWAAGGVLWLTTYAAHASNALAVMPAGEVVSYSYFYFGGVPLLIRALMFHGLFPLLPWWMAVPLGAVLAVAALSRKMPAELRWTGLAYALVLLCVGQPFNYYWGAMIAPVFACWLPFVYFETASSFRSSPTD